MQMRSEPNERQFRRATICRGWQPRSPGKSTEERRPDEFAHPTGYVQRRATSRWCQRSSVRGLTEKADQVRRGSARLNAAKNTRSASCSCGRCACRRRIESSCRSTRISSSFDSGERQHRTISSNRWQTTKYASDRNTRDLQQTGKPTLPSRYLSTTPRPSDRVFEPHASGSPRHPRSRL
jgi:hypothetical protein